MSALIGKFMNVAASWKNILELNPWDAFFYGGQRILGAEERCLVPYQQFSSLPTLTSLGLSRTQLDRHYRFSVGCGLDAERDVSLSQIETTLEQCYPQGCRHAVLDLTSLELDTLLYLLPFLVRMNLESLLAVYLVPKNYDHHETGLDYQNIQQPRGYVSFRPGLAGERDAAHFVILGFDRGRAPRFIEHYDWDRSRIHALIGDPSYVQKNGKSGVEIALESNNDWLANIPTANRHAIAADNPMAVRDFFAMQLNNFGFIDVLPLGPKPMLLGFLLFYWPLPEGDRARVRLLYDFPTPKTGCTTGISKGYWFDCRELLSS